jgi:hypothetical protein
MGAIVGHGYGSGTGMDTFTLEQLASITVQFELGAWELVRCQYVVST